LKRDYPNCTKKKTCSSAGIKDSFLASLTITEGEAICDYCWYPYMSASGLTLILATLDGLDVGLLEDVIGENDCDDNG
nr:telomerase Cajal body protein 1 [Tanacetum cinerariifolium]